jgi:arginase
MDKIRIIKNRSDIGAGTRGSDLGIDAIEIAAINMKSDYFNRFDYLDVETENEVVYEKQNAVFAKRITKVLTVCSRLGDAVKLTLNNKEFPLVLSGDHSSALGTISGLKMAYPEKRLGVVWIDAHADIHSPYTTPSGNVHGMPLAAALADDNLDRKINDLEDETDQSWEGLKNIGGISPKVLHEDVIYFGVRDTEEPEEYAIQKNNIKNYRVDEVRYRGMDVCITEALEKLKDCDFIYISFDVDSMDCDLISYGTGTPVQNGLTEQEASSLINHLLIDKRANCFEIVEINPCLDNKQNKMAETAFRILESATSIIEKRG